MSTMRHTLRSALTAAMLIALAACGSSTQQTLTAADPSTPATPGQSQPANPTTLVTTTATSATPDPFEQYFALVGPLEPNLSKQELRDKLKQAVSMYCGGGREAMLRLKDLASGPRNSAEDQRRANERAATSIGALWEFGCGRGHDAALYKPDGAPAEWNETSAAASTPSGSGRRDANGETKAEYCARTHQQLDRCQAG